MIELLDKLTRNRGISYYLIPVIGGRKVKEESLTECERLTFDSLRSKKRKDEWLSGRYAAKKALYNFNGDTDAKVDSLDSGQPYFPDYPSIHLSISHSNSYAVAIVSKKRIGIDIELIEGRPESICKYFYTSYERDKIENLEGIARDRLMTEFWTRKEAISKLISKGGSVPFNSINTTSDQVFIPRFFESTITLVSDFIGDYSISIAVEDEDG